jgi:hypothetical protein
MNSENKAINTKNTATYRGKNTNKNPSLHTCPSIEFYACADYLWKDTQDWL